MQLPGRGAPVDGTSGARVFRLLVVLDVEHQPALETHPLPDEVQQSASRPILTGGSSTISEHGRHFDRYPLSRGRVGPCRHLDVRITPEHRETVRKLDPAAAHGDYVALHRGRSRV